MQDIASHLLNQGKETNSHRAYLGVQTGTTISGAQLLSEVQAAGPPLVPRSGPVT